MKRNSNKWYHIWSFIDDLQTHLFKPALKLKFGTYPIGEQQIDALANLQICTISPNPRTPRENYCRVSVTCNCAVEIEMHISNTFKNKLTTILKKKS